MVPFVKLAIDLLAALSDLLSISDAEFQNTARRILTKNRDLYKRLAL